MILDDHQPLREVAIRHRELVSRRQLLEQLDRLARYRLPFAHAPGEEQQPRERPQRISLAVSVADGPLTLERALLRVDRLVDLGAQAAFLCASAKERRADLERLIVGDPQSTGVLIRGLAVGSRARGALPRERRPPKHSGGIARGLGMVREAREIRIVAGGERLDRGTVQVEPAVRCDRLLDRDPREIVAERDVSVARSQHARREAFVDPVTELAGNRFEQPQLDLSGNDRDRLEQPPRRQPRGVPRAQAPRHERFRGSVPRRPRAPR